MKRTILLITSFLLLANLSKSQELELTIGPGISKYNLRQVNFPTYITQYETFKHKYIVSVIGGVNLKLNLSKNLYSKVGLNYSMKGNREYTVYNSYVSNHPDSTVQMVSDGTWNLHYIDFPVTVHFRKIHTFVGGQVSYLWRANSRFHSVDTYTYNGQVYETDIQKGNNVFDLGTIKSFNRIDFGIIIGFEYPLNQKTQLALRYYQGINGVLNNDFFVNYKNSQLVLALSYNLTKKEAKK